MEKIQEYAYIVVALIMVVEYLIGVSKLKSNSTIEMVINILKFVFGIKETPKTLE
jgi:N-acetylmuramic acid 6-phosphate (MurNAc-6-P) etherase|tara:strand:+ start:781 stop:945 length:165 start_codon:yes stop_codon:yes gene_type:complete